QASSMYSFLLRFPRTLRSSRVVFTWRGVMRLTTRGLFSPCLLFFLVLLTQPRWTSPGMVDTQLRV
ncbi:MAG TPA: hypothetical protein VG013_27185, partial [Gemmataceae bacterium]|nr:hypothetical protein [Gemmataceae bacterium]